MNLATPRNNKAEILYTLLERGSVSIKDFPYLSGFRTRISELVNEDSIPLLHENRRGENKFGNIYTYKEHILPDVFREITIQKYNAINNPN